MRLVFESGRPIAHVAADLGVGAETLRKRVRQAKADSGGRTDLLTTQEREEIRRLRRESFELRRANEIVKAASVFFASLSVRPGSRQAARTTASERLLAGVALREQGAGPGPTEVSAFVGTERGRFGVEPIRQALLTQRIGHTSYYRPRPSATASTASNGSSESRPSSPGSPSNAGATRRRPTGSSICAASAHCATLARYLRQSKGAAGWRSTVRRSPPSNGSTASTYSPPATLAVGRGRRARLQQPQQAERSFRDLKGTLLLRPVFHRKDDRTRAHVLVCFLALVLVRLAETRSGETWRTIRAELGQIRQGHFRSTEGDFTQTSELTRRQQQLHAALGVPEPPRFGRITAAAGQAA